MNVMKMRCGDSIRPLRCKILRPLRCRTASLKDKSKPYIKKPLQIWKRLFLLCKSEILQRSGPASFSEAVFPYLSPDKLCSIIAILESASASFLRSISRTFSGAPATNFSLANLDCTDFRNPFV